jgi:hypothetical protein
MKRERCARGSIILGLALAAAIAALALAGRAKAAEITADRPNHADREPQNWLMNDRTYDANAAGQYRVTMAFCTPNLYAAWRKTP